ncbi:hypothetical protein CFC21_092381 [Triticum aestivum]|nr:uncharacterized protein LOC109761182 isoform X4 [Aegilops tauschii subsp. strangulata]XP_044419349.1 uncharacterized protein LOC123144317 isoform X2 [Triticum aestivum]KAF7089392.1 hypothetical protein CFC21_092381 [Triticum aestivum]
MSPPHRRVPTAYAAAQAPPTTPLLSNHRRELWRRKQSNMKSFCSGRLVRRLGFGVKQSEVYEPGGDDCRIPVIECVYEWIQVLEILGVILVPENNSLRSVGWTSGAETPGDVSKSVLHNKGALRMMAFMLVWMMLVR